MLHTVCEWSFKKWSFSMYQFKNVPVNFVAELDEKKILFSKQYNFRLFKPLSVNPGEKIKNAVPSPSAFRGKKSRAQLHHLYMFLCFGIFFRKARSVTVPKMPYIFVQHGIIPLIGICHLKLVSFCT